VSALGLSTGTLAALVVMAVVDLFAIILGLSFLRARRAQREAEAAAAVPVAERTPPPAGLKPIARRDFLRRSLLGSLAVFGAQFGAASIAFLWPNLKGGFGSKLRPGKLADIVSEIESTKQPFYFGQGRFYIVKYDGSGVDREFDVDYAADGALVEGVLALYQRCVHLGCRVPFCDTSKWFECPCHGSKYNQVGEYKLGPAPRGMDRFPITLEGEELVVDTSTVILGPPRGTDTTGRGIEGPFCV
jgi:cytochrome b6-f complex iron-sulfur subunit